MTWCVLSKRKLEMIVIFFTFHEEAHGLTIVLFSQECHLLVTLKVMNTYVAFSAKRIISMQKPVWRLFWLKCVRCTFIYSRAESGHLLSDGFVSLQYAQNGSNLYLSILDMEFWDDDLNLNWSHYHLNCLYFDYFLF